MQKLRFNKTNIENIEAKESRFKIYSDECKGLYVDVFPSGKKTYRVLYKLNYRNFHYTIGVHPEINRCTNMVLKCLLLLTRNATIGGLKNTKLTILIAV